MILGRFVQFVAILAVLTAGILVSPEVVSADEQVVIAAPSVVISPVSDLSGTWSGSWRSCKSGHQGPMQADFCRLSNGDYKVDFRGRFFKLFPFRYSVTLQVIEETDVVRLQGSSYLGRVFGTFCYSATADDCQFRANYTSRKDNGIFELRRVGR